MISEQLQESKAVTSHSSAKQELLSRLFEKVPRIKVFNYKQLQKSHADIALL